MTHKPKQFGFLLALVVIAVLGSVLTLTVLRVQNPRQTVDTPQAADAYCTNEPSCCSGMSGAGFDGCTWPERGWCKPDQCSAAVGKGTNICSKGNRCSISKKGCSGPGNVPDPSKCSAADGTCEEANGPANCQCGILNSAYCGGGTTPPPPGGGGGNQCGQQDPNLVQCTNNCVNNIRPGNCSYCRTCCGAGNCAAGGGTLKIEVSCPNNCAGLKVFIEGPTSGGKRFSEVLPANNLGEWANKQSGSGSYSTQLLKDQQILDEDSGNLTDGGTLTMVLESDGGGGGGSTTCTTDSECVGSPQPKVCVAGVCRRTVKSHLECVNNACKWVKKKGDNLGGCTTVGQACGGTGTAQCSVDGDCQNGQVCTLDGTCKAPTDTHFSCVSGACARLSGGGDNKHGCTANDQICSTVVNSCWGDEGKNGQCFDCDGNGEINILDFSCFACNYEQKVTVGTNPSCKDRDDD